jgi:DNA-directed RNA polymerase subunit beta'
MRVDDLEAIKIKLASPEDILEWSHGEVTKPETINYRTQRPEKDGLFCEVIFGPEKDYQCYCGKYKRIRYKGVVCDRCGVEVTTSRVRRERMGHIKLASPVAHIWFLRSIPSRMGLVLNIPGQQLEKVIYFAGYIITKVDQEQKKNILEEIEKEYKEKIKNLALTSKAGRPLGSKTKKKSFEESPRAKIKIEELKKARDKARGEVLSLEPLKILSEIDYQRLSLKYGHIFEAGTGAEALKKIFEKIDLKKEIANLKKEILDLKGEVRKKKYLRLRFLEEILEEGIKPEWMFLEVLPVLPPDLRPMVQLDGGRFASSDLNDLYRRVINRNNRLKYLLEISAPDVIVRNEKRMLQEAVDALIDNTMRKGQMTKATTGGRRLLKSLADMLKGKQGRFRQNLLGKRVDYSGRSVIVIGPELQLHQVGLPKKMALELFKPFVIRKILEKELAFNVRGAGRLIDEKTDEVWALLEQVVKDKLVLLNRAPTLHRLGIQAFEPVLIEGEAIRIHPLVCKAFNADFDGDQMAVHLPLSEEAQKEAKERMLSSRNLLKPATGKPIVVPTQDIVLGIFWLTRIEEGAKGESKIFGSFEEAVLAQENGLVALRAKIKIYQNKNKVIETTVGRILFNEVLPEDYPFQNETLNSQKLSNLISDIINRYQPDQIEKLLDEIKKLGFEFSTLAGISWGMDDLILPKEKKEIMEKAEAELEKIEGHFKQGFLSREERRIKNIEIWQKAKFELERVVPKVLPPHGSVFTMVESGSKGSWLQVIQMTGMKGLVINPAGQVIELPARSSYKEGFSVLEYFISTHGARKGTVDTALRTSTAGYLTRRLIDVAHEVIINEEDCGDKNGILIKADDAEEIGQNLDYKIVGRVSLQDLKIKNKIILKKGEVIDWEKAKIIKEKGIDKINIRSPLSCQTKRGICQKCYGWDLGNNKLVKLGEAVGIVAAQAIGEPGTQLTMRTFHTGGVAGGGDITLGLPRVEEVFEARPPSGKAVISKVKGKVISVSDRMIKIKPVNENPGRKKNKKPGPLKEVLEIEISPLQSVWVKEGEKVEKGQQLCEGSVDLGELYRLVKIEEVWSYIIKEIQRIYCSQGAAIHDKHIEVIVRQMFSRVKIKDPRDSKFMAGQITELASFIEERERLKKESKKPPLAKRLLLGITRVALSTESFLSAASFQETSRVIIKAALAGQEDKLRGLKENVIIGKLIPAGTGFNQ